MAATKKAKTKEKVAALVPPAPPPPRPSGGGGRPVDEDGPATATATRAAHRSTAPRDEEAVLHSATTRLPPTARRAGAPTGGGRDPKTDHPGQSGAVFGRLALAYRAAAPRATHVPESAPRRRRSEAPRTTTGTTSRRRENTPNARLGHLRPDTLKVYGGSHRPGSPQSLLGGAGSNPRPRRRDRAPSERRARNRATTTSQRSRA
jgi:hypothetical protein